MSLIQLLICLLAESQKVKQKSHKRKKREIDKPAASPAEASQQPGIIHCFACCQFKWSDAFSMICTMKCIATYMIND